MTGHFDHFNLSVNFEFGFGLSYTTFSLGNVSVTALTDSITAVPEEQAIAPGGNPALWDNIYKITTSVTNTGSVAGATVPQLYLGLPQIPNEATTPVKALRGFDKVYLEPGETAEVTFELARRDISYWNT